LSALRGHGTLIIASHSQGDTAVKVHARVLLVALASMTLISPTVALAQVVKRTGSGLLSTLKSGQWIRLDGTIQKDGTVLCSEVRLLAGDFLDDEWSVRGMIRSLDSGRRRLTIGRYPILVEEDAVFDTEGGFSQYADLRVGTLVEVEGTYRRDRTFLANEVDDESDEVRRKQGLAEQIRIVAKVERVDASRRRITAMGTVFQVTSRTQIMSMLR
jgi:hypothetical protein